MQVLEKSYTVNINLNLTVDNLRASISKKSNIPANEFKLSINRHCLTGTTKLKDL